MATQGLNAGTRNSPGTPKPLICAPGRCNQTGALKLPFCILMFENPPFSPSMEIAAALLGTLVFTYELQASSCITGKDIVFLLAPQAPSENAGNGWQHLGNIRKAGMLASHCVSIN